MTDYTQNTHQALLQQSNQDLLNSLHVGFWTLATLKNGDQTEMSFDATMYQLLGVPEGMSGEECFEVWHKRIHPAAINLVRQSFARMSKTDQAVQIVFPWNHPEKGEIMLRMTGILVEETATAIKFKRYCREASEAFLPEEKKVEVE